MAAAATTVAVGITAVEDTTDAVDITAAGVMRVGDLPAIGADMTIVAERLEASQEAARVADSHAVAVAVAEAIMATQAAVDTTVGAVDLAAAVADSPVGAVAAIAVADSTVGAVAAIAVAAMAVDTTK